ncbi:MAG: MarR family winged helix-turn-helix transcriptional regulator [Thermoleophilia bacterium]
MERTLASHDPPLTVVQLQTLRAIDGGRGMGADIARAAGITQAAVSQVVGALERAGLVARGERDPQDRRRQALALTTDGRATLASAETLVAGRLEALIGDLPGPELDALDRSLSRVADAVAGVPPPRRPAPPPPRPPGPPGRR